MKLKKQRKPVILCPILILLSGCTKNTINSFCLIYEPIYPNYETDTSETIKQIDRNNIAYEELCN